MSESLFDNPAKMIGGFPIHNEEEKPFALPLHKHDLNSELLFIDEGLGTFTIDGISYEVGPGTVLFYQRGVWHEELSTGYPFRAIYIGFQGLQVKGLPPDFFLDPNDPPLILLREQTSAVKHILSQCLTEFHSTAPESRTMANHWFGILLARLARIAHYHASPGETRRSQTAVMRAISHIEENYRNAITLKLLARVSNVNEYHLAHLFKDEIGVSPIQFLIRYRIDVAKRYLATTKLSMSDISELVGYQSETSFHNVFKKMTGRTPGQFRSESDER